jgi:uncharacterized protein
MRITWLLFIFACFTAFGQLPERPKNPPTAYNEFSKERFLSKADASQIEEELRAFEEETSNAIVVVVVDDLMDMEIEQYADELGEAWGVGTAERDNGIVMLIKPFGEGKRQVTIQVGRGLEGVIPDLVCKDIIDREFIPNMKKDSPLTAIKSSLKVLKDLAKKEYSYKDYQKPGLGSIIGAVFALLVLILVIYAMIKGGGGTTIGGRGYRGGFWGGFGGGFGGGNSGGSSGGFGGFGGGSFGGGGASGDW